VKDSCVDLSLFGCDLAPKYSQEAAYFLIIVFFFSIRDPGPGQDGTSCSFFKPYFFFLTPPIVLYSCCTPTNVCRGELFFFFFSLLLIFLTSPQGLVCDFLSQKIVHLTPPPPCPLDYFFITSLPIVLSFLLAKSFPRSQ